MPSITPTTIVRFQSGTVRGQTEELPVELSSRVLSLTYTDKTRGADTCGLVLDNNDLALLDEPRFAEGQKLVVQWGYLHDMAPARTIEIKKITGWKQLKLEGVDDGAAASIAHARSQSWEAATEYEVATEVARRLGFRTSESFSIEEPAGMVRRPITQAAETDAAFLNRLADRVDAVFRISAGRFYFRPQALASEPAFVFTYRGATGDFAGEPSISKGTLGIPGRVTRRGRSTQQRTNTRGSAGNDTDTQRPTLGADTVVRDPGERTAASASEAQAVADDNARFAFFTGADGLDECLPQTVHSDAEAQQAAQNRFRRAERRSIEMTWPLVGVPRLTADTVVRGLGLGQRISGNFLVTEVAHNVGKKYLSSCKVTRNAQSRSSAAARSRSAQQRSSLQNARQQASIDAEALAPRSSTGQWEILLDSIEAGSGPGAADCSGRVNDAPTAGRDVRELSEVQGTDPDGNATVSYQRPGGGR